jgi:hypothetical protein
MGKCPNCGESFLFLTPSEICDWCGKVVCKKCLPEWIGWFSVKEKMETASNEAEYRKIGFCSEICGENFWQKVMNYPLVDIGTEVNEFGENLRRLFYSAVLDALSRSTGQNEDAINRVAWAVENDTFDYRALIVDLGDNGMLEPVCGYEHIGDFTVRGYSALALNLEKCGRPLDAAEIYEKHLRMYDKARSLREKDKQAIVKRTEISINLNELLSQIRDGGIVAVYRCPHCNGTLKINDKTSLKSLKTCEHCGSEIETVDLADFLRTALS